MLCNMCAACVWSWLRIEAISAPSVVVDQIDLSDTCTCQCRFSTDQVLHDDKVYGALRVTPLPQFREIGIDNIMPLKILHVWGIRGIYRVYHIIFEL